MSQAAGNIDDADASHLWDQLSERIDGFATAWQQGGEPPKLADFLPEAPGALRRLTLIEAIKIDLEYRWQAGPTPKRVEDYVAEFPELLGSGGVPCDIIYEEYHIRKQRGDAVAPTEYFERFPDRVEELRRLLQLETPEQTTALVAAEPVPVFEVGERVDDFELISKLGKGAFATVFLARQVSMQRLVALKISRDRGFEPQTLAQLEHQNIVRVYDQRQLAAGKLRLLYMQYVQAGTLQSVVEHAKKVPPALRSGATLLESIDKSLAKNNEQPPTDSMTRHRLQRASWYEVVCWLGARLASALSYAHGRGVLHRDVKPANVLVGADGQPKLADFNISFSKLDGATPAAYFGGSLAYMSPEQLEACDPAHARQPEELDGRSDVYSLGIMLWELLVLRRPFAEDSLPQTWSNALAKMTTVRRGGISPEVIAAVPRDCPRAIVDVLLKCLEPEVEKRYASAAELSRELDLCLQPRAHALLHGASWRAVAKRHPVVTTVLIGVLPNIVMCFVNIGYNWDQIMAGLSIADQNVFLYTIILGINTLSYAVGLGYVFITRGRLFKNLMQLARGQKVDPPPSDETIRRCLTLGSATAGITAMLWTASGFVIPAWMYLQAGESSTLAFEDYRHFVISGLLCGMIAATQSYFLVTFLCIRFDFPWLVQARGGDALELTALAEVPRRNRLFLALTVAVPIVALTAFALLNLQAEGEVVGSNVIAALGIMGMVGCGLAYLLDLTIRADVGALAATMNPNSDALMSTDTLDSFLSGTRR